LLFDRGFVGRLLDSEQEVAGLYVLAFDKFSLLDEPWDARNNVDLVYRRYATNEVASR